MDAITKLKTEVNLVEHIQKALGQQGKNETQGTRFKSSAEDKTPSLLVYKDQAKGYNDYSGVLGGGTIIDFQMKFYNQEMKDAVKTLCDTYNIQDDNKKEFKKSPKRYVLAENFEEYRLTGNTSGFTRFLGTRGIDFDFITHNTEIINELAKEFGICENVWIKDKIYKDVVIFPCLKNGNICGTKLRTTDKTMFSFNGKDLKSVSVGKPKDYKGSFPFSTGLIYSELSEKYVLIVEGETDYIILKLLGFKSVIGNLGGVSSNADEIQSLIKTTEQIVCMYDNDRPGIVATHTLQKKVGRPIRKILYPEIEGKPKYDINDLYNMGYKKEDFNKLVKESLLLDDAKMQDDQPLYKKRFFYDNTKLNYFDIKDFAFVGPHVLARHFFIKPTELEDLREKDVIPTYEGICYLDGGRKNYFNLLDKTKISHPSKTPEIHPDIKFLIDNLCNHEEDNIKWLQEAIIYKYTNMNDVLVPAVVFHGVGGTGKGLFIKLLAQIFGENNTQEGLTQDHIESRFSAYSGQKLIVEFTELSVDNTIRGKKNMNKLKTLIMQPKMTIEKKGQDAISVDNIAWFIMSSNENKPIQLDSVDSGNRRFTIMKTGEAVGLDKGGRIAKAIEDKKNIENFLARLLEKFPEIKTKKNILPLENQDKKDLEFLSESVGNLFFKWLEEKYPDIKKISITSSEMNYLVDLYRVSIGEDKNIYEDRYTKFFKDGLSVRYKYTTFRKGTKTHRGYVINKKVSGTGYFEEGKFDKETELDITPKPF